MTLRDNRLIVEICGSRSNDRQAQWMTNWEGECKWIRTIYSTAIGGSNTIGWSVNQAQLQHNICNHNIKKHLNNHPTRKLNQDSCSQCKEQDGKTLEIKNALLRWYIQKGKALVNSLFAIDEDE